METAQEKVSDTQKNWAAVTVMRVMLIKYSEKNHISFKDALLRFTASNTYDALFDFETEIWKEGPDYLMELFERLEKT